MSKKIAYLVLGPHRSGTSLVSGLLSILGCALGKDVLGPHDCNQRGLWENEAVVSLNEIILSEMKASWHDTGVIDFSAFSLEDKKRWVSLILTALSIQFADIESYDIVIKDPRICRLLPLYAAALTDFGCEIRIVQVLRDPHSVAFSLYKRDGMSFSSGYMLWASHMLQGAKQSHGYRKLVLEYSDILENSELCIDKLMGLLGKSHDLQLKVEALEFVDANLDHSGSEKAVDLVSATVQAFASEVDCAIRENNVHGLSRLYLRLLREQGARKHILSFSCVRYLPSDQSLVDERFSVEELSIIDGGQEIVGAGPLKMYINTRVFYNHYDRGAGESFLRAIGLLPRRNLLLFERISDFEYSRLVGLVVAMKVVDNAVIFRSGNDRVAVYLPQACAEQIDPWRWIGQGKDFFSSVLQFPDTETVYVDFNDIGDVHGLID